MPNLTAKRLFWVCGKQKRIDFLHARKQKKIMEKLHEKKITEHKLAMRKDEQKKNDELYTTRHQLEKLLGEGNEHE